MRSLTKLGCTLLFTALMGSAPAIAAEKNVDWRGQIAEMDKSYWEAFNRADPVGMNRLLTKDVEFYHDRGGSLIGKAALSRVNNEMRTSKDRIRRELIPDTMKLFPLHRGDKIYGAIMTGEHQFYISSPDKTEKLAGKAYFNHLLLLKNGSWHIARIYSYEHVDADGKN